MGRRSSTPENTSSAPKASFGQLMPYLLEHKKVLSFVIVLSVIGAAASLAQPLLVGQVINRVVQLAQDSGCRFVTPPQGLFGWVGFNQKALPYHREARVAGRSSFGFWKLWNFALEGITSFTTAPLRVATYIGVLTALLAFAFALYIVGKALLFGDPVAGWPTMMAVILFLGGMQLVALGLIGEYLGRLYEESKQRPLYLVDTWHPATAGVSLSPPDRPVPPPGDRHAHGSSVAGVQDP